MIDIICQYKVFCILSALAVGVAILFGCQIGKAKAREKDTKEQRRLEDAYNEQLQRDAAFLKQYFKAKSLRK